MRVEKRDGWFYCDCHDLVVAVDQEENVPGYVDVGNDSDACHICGCYHFDDMDCTWEDFQEIWADYIEPVQCLVGKLDGTYEVEVS